MKRRRDPTPEFDLFIPLMGDLPLKDQRETMERPFFSLQKRKRVKPGTDPADVPARLARTSSEKSRRLLARLPLQDGPDGPRPAPGAGARLPSGKRGLWGALADDEHLGPFLGIPGKDNGFDVEGVAVLGERVVLGLRGPVLRGWAVLLGLAVHVDGTVFVTPNGLSSSMHLTARSRKMSSVAARVVVPGT